jgi:hydroxyethylthiazole kinase-like uncharacterized protein yjeF
MHLSHRGEEHATSRPAALDEELLRAWPLPLDEEGDKLSRGTVLVVAGSVNTAGAAILAGIAALRMGAGRLQIATPASISVGLSIAVPEAMVLPLPVNADGELSLKRSFNPLMDHVPEAQAVLIGPGMASPPAIARIVREVAAALAEDALLVLDAAALQTIGEVGRTTLAAVAKRLILTPNRQELKAVVEALGHDDSGGDPASVAAQSLGAVVSCFGELTSFDGRRWQAEPATPGLGTSGSGDVLAGLVAGAAARSGDPAQAACWAAYVHGAAGNRLSNRVGTTSFIARELLGEVPFVLAELE